MAGWQDAVKTPVIEHEDATDAQVLEAALMGYRVLFEGGDVYHWQMWTPGEKSVFNFYYTEREAWSAAWVHLRSREGVEA